MISKERLDQLIFAANHNGFGSEQAINFFKGVSNGSGQVRVTCYELRQLLESYIERRTDNAESVQDSAGDTDKVSE